MKLYTDEELKELNPPIGTLVIESKNDYIGYFIILSEAKQPSATSFGQPNRWPKYKVYDIARTGLTGTFYFDSTYTYEFVPP